MDRISGVFTAVLPTIVGVAALILLLSIVVARRLVKNIIDPLNNINFDSDDTNVYDELLPYVKKIDQQKSEIASQIVMLKNRADTIETITGNMKEGLILIDKAGIVLVANKSASTAFAQKDMPGKSIRHVCRDIDFSSGVKECLSGVNSEIVFVRGDKVYSVYFSSVYDGGELNGGVIFLHDISEKHEAEKQRREFSANVSHELKTPLTTISALSEMIENGMAKEGDIKVFAGKITLQSQRLINIIEDIIKLSEFDEDKIFAQFTEFDLYDLALSVVEILREKADEKHIAIEIIGEHFPMTANKQMIDELLYNLIDNAIKYNMDNGSVTIMLSKENELLKIAVADTGIGISPEDQSHVFERFYRADKSRSKKTGGTGLGLSIVKHIVGHHGGKVALTSDSNMGTTVECWFVGG
ncbi:MAG: ATP-binding protein [Oscillospiraceae bacterium]|nr:ATP-binding protein [Oscillospiraceae bacterium]